MSDCTRFKYFSHTRQCLDGIRGISASLAVVQEDVFFVKALNDRVSDLVECTLRYQDTTKDDLGNISPILSTLTNCKETLDKIGTDLDGQKILLENLPKVIKRKETPLKSSKIAI